MIEADWVRGREDREQEQGLMIMTFSIMTLNAYADCLMLSV